MGREFQSLTVQGIPIDDFNWIRFNDEPRAQERQQLKDQQSCISIFVASPTVPISN